MRMKLNAILLLISILLSCGAGCTDTGRYAVSAKGGTLGLGGEFTTGITSNINARVGINALDVDLDDKEIDDIEYDLGVAFTSSPDVTLTASGGTEPPGFDEELAKVQEDIEDFFDKFKLYPIISINFFYGF